MADACKMIYEKPKLPYHYGKWTCSNCGAWWMRPPYDLSYAKECPNCKAVVADDRV